MEVTLSEQESAAVQKALRSYTSDLRMEIVDTDNAGYRRELREERELLESLLNRLDSASRSSGQGDAEGRIVVELVTVWTTD